MADKIDPARARIPAVSPGLFEEMARAIYEAHVSGHPDLVDQKYDKLDGQSQDLYRAMAKAAYGVVAVRGGANVTALKEPKK
jgi:hypothetical protein